MTRASEALYEMLPFFAQNAICSIYGARQKRIRQGPLFKEYYISLLATDWASAYQIEEGQGITLKRLVRHAYMTTEFYQKIFDDAGVDAKYIGTRSDLRRLPVLDKEEMQRNVRSLVSKSRHGRRLVERRTSGTTGTPLRFFSSRESIAFQWAVWWRHRYRFGFKPGVKSLNFTGKPVVPASQKRAPFWRWNLPEHQALVNMSQITPKKVAAIGSFIDKQEFDVFTGYPSIIASFLELLREQHCDLVRSPAAIFLGAEPLLETQKNVMETTTDSLISDQYGFSEGCGNAARCPVGNYHEDWEFGILEPEDEVVEWKGGESAILATGFSNFGFPLIRYRVGDVAQWAPPGYMCECGRESRVIFSIDGRCEDYVLTPEGSKIMRFDYVFKNAGNIVEAQVVQEKSGSIVVRYVSIDELETSVLREIKRRIATYISPELEVEFDRIPSIPRTETGKFRAVVSEVEETFGE